MSGTAIDFLAGKKVLMVFSHPDDEIICGFPVLQDRNIEKKILICSSDLNNPERSWCSHRKIPLSEMCKDLGIVHKCLDYNSEFYRMDTRQSKLSAMMKHVSEEIDGFDYDYIFTHNVIGEYGHIDHQLIHQVVAQKARPTIVTDIFIPSNWCPYDRISDTYAKMYNVNSVGRVRNDIDFYAKCKRFYDSHNVWTWSKSPVMECGLYVI